MDRCWEVGWGLPSSKLLQAAGCLGGSSEQGGGSRWPSEAPVSPHFRVSLRGKLAAGTGKITWMFPTLGLFMTFTQIGKGKKTRDRSQEVLPLAHSGQAAPFLHTCPAFLPGSPVLGAQPAGPVRHQPGKQRRTAGEGVSRRDLVT